ncbi:MULTISPECIES: hypothetical protein [unclassified Nocardioides]|uniref:hypothetical protein n=1 Tax=unclassified Nocardioides TaxID=2615069 RepID=UPI0000571E60|nr:MULTISPECIES: hypothetical protein [unclassified Nocardioides]ABL79289.1 hypothetical protein Noca_4703 [Nocardioides sp. JS614]
MLNREQQHLLGSLGAGMTADALLDRLRERGTLEGGRSAPQDGCWINYNRKAVWLEDHSEFSAALRAAADASAADATQAWRRIRPKVVLKVTWAEAAAYGTRLPQELRTELDTLRRTERDENRIWSEFSDERGGWPWRRRYATDEEHKAAETEWDAVYGKHLVALREVWDRQKAAIARALPLTVDDEPVDLLELLDQQPAAPAVPTQSATMQAGALRAPATAPSPAPATAAPPEEGLFSLPSTDPSIGR